jgi:hypothetical protein
MIPINDMPTISHELPAIPKNGAVLVDGIHPLNGVGWFVHKSIIL